MTRDEIIHRVRSDDFIEEQLLRLATEFYDDYEICCAIAISMCAGYDTLTKLSEHPNPFVRFYVLFSRNTPEEIRKQLLLDKEIKNNAQILSYLKDNIKAEWPNFMVLDQDIKNEILDWIK